MSSLLRRMLARLRCSNSRAQVGRRFRLPGFEILEPRLPCGGFVGAPLIGALAAEFESPAFADNLGVGGGAGFHGHIPIRVPILDGSWESDGVWFDATRQIETDVWGRANLNSEWLPLITETGPRSFPANVELPNDDLGGGPPPAPPDIDESSVAPEYAIHSSA